MLGSTLSHYNALPIFARLIFAGGAITVLNAGYCLAYRASIGNPATLSEAFSWGIINLAPWVAVIEIGRHQRSLARIAALLAAGLVVSLVLGAAYQTTLPDTHEWVRRVPGAILSVACLALLAWRGKHAAQERQAPVRPRIAARNCLWARAAGNYVEVTGSAGRPLLVRCALSQFIAQSDQKLLRIHRSFAVSPDAVETIERNYVRLRDGTRLPIGNAYREGLADRSFVPSSQRA